MRWLEAILSLAGGTLFSNEMGKKYIAVFFSPF
jgi:hypothetical protein